MQSLTYEEYRDAIQQGKFAEDALEKKLLIREENAVQLIITDAVRRCMQYTLDNFREVIFKYDPNTKKGGD